MSDDSVLLELEGFPALQHLGKLWHLLQRDGHHFDQFSVGNTRRPLGADPLAKLSAWVKKPGTRTLTLGSTHQNHFLFLTRFQGMRPALKLRFDWGARPVDGWLAWLDELLKLGPLERGVLHAPAIPSANLYVYGGHASWLFLCGGAERKKLEGAGVPKFLAKKKGVFLRTVKSTLVIGLTKSPLVPFAGGVASLTRPVDDLLLDAVEKKAKVDVLKLTRAAFAKTLGPKGFTEVPGGHRRELLWTHGLLTLEARMSPHGDFTVFARHQGSTPNSYFPWRLAEGTVATTAKTLTRALDTWLAGEAKFVKNPRRFR